MGQQLRPFAHQIHADKSDIVLGAQIGEPVSGKDAFHGNRHLFSGRGYHFKKQLRGTR
jgi:hypothetical protein